MRLLITTQAVDLDDPILGFFHRWIEELAKKYEHVSVICLKEGKHDLPPNVRVYSLGKESGRSRLKYVLRFFKYIFALRNEYDVVFVHMNSEYVCLGGIFWRAWGKRIVLWRNHPKRGFSTWLAVQIAQAVCYTSSSAYVARFKKAVQMPLGIDTQTFAPNTSEPKANSILFLGRLDEIKRPHVFIQALQILREKGVAFSADIVGDSTYPDSAYPRELQKSAETLTRDSLLSFHRSVKNTEAPEIFRAHSVYVNLTQSGSFDKTIGEAFASGCIVITCNDAVRGVIPDEFIVTDSVESIAAALQHALCMSAPERRSLTSREREYVIKEHSLALLIERLSTVIA